MKHFTINQLEDVPVRVDYDEHDITITDERHADDNSITLTRIEFGKIVDGIIANSGKLKT
jgi:hypothetical protein